MASYRLSKKPILFLSLLSGLILVWLFIQSVPDGQAAPLPEIASPAEASSVGETPVKGPVQLVQTDPAGVTVEFTLPDFNVENDQAEGQVCQTFTVQGMFQSDQSGKPELPLVGMMVGIPAGAQPIVRILEAEPEDLTGNYKVCPVVTPISRIQPEGGIEFLGYERSFDSGSYQINQSSPAEAAMLVDTAQIRSQHVAQVRFQPFQYNPVTGRVRVYRRVVVRLDFGAAVSSAAQSPVVDEGAFEAGLKDSLINYKQAIPFREQTPRQPVSSRPEKTTSTPAYKLLVVQDGMYRLTYTDLQTAGLPVDTLDPRTLQLKAEGVEVALQVNGEGDGVFNPSDELLFYGQVNETKYSNVNTYWLTWGITNGLRMNSWSAFPGGGLPVSSSYSTTYRLENNTYYMQALPSGPDEDHFYWARLYTYGAAVSWQETFSLNNLATIPTSATLTGYLYGYSAGLKAGYNVPLWQNADVYINNRLIHHAQWGATDEYIFTARIPHSWLVNGINTIRITLPVLEEGVAYKSFYINKFNLTYRRSFQAESNKLTIDIPEGDVTIAVNGFSTPDLLVFDVTCPDIPSRVTNVVVESDGTIYRVLFDHTGDRARRYQLLESTQLLKPQTISIDQPSNLKNNLNRADYLIISHANFLSSIQPLVDFRISQGYSVTVVDIQDVYDEFSFGRMSPEAIRNFLIYAANKWVLPTPIYVLLVGDGNYDPKNLLKVNEPVYIPPYLDNVDLWIGEVPTDNRFAMISGDDELPDLYLGRLPVKTSVETTDVVNKIIAYEQDPPIDTWKGNVMFVADNPDAAGQFHMLSDIAAAYVPAPYVVDKVYHPLNQPSGIATRFEITSGLKEGRLLVSYVGHGSILSWAGSPSLLDGILINEIENMGKLAFFVPMTCLEGYGVVPSSTKDSSAVAERLLRLPERGSIASFSPAGLGLASGHDVMERGLFKALFYDYIDQIGPATNYSKIYLAAQTGGAYKDLIETYMLYGDPATRLPLFKPELSLSKTALGLRYPDADTTVVDYRLTYTNTGQGSGTNLVVTDQLLDWAKSASFTFAGPVVKERSGASYIFDIGCFDDECFEYLAPGARGQITISVVVDSDTTSGYGNFATISGSGEISPTVGNTAASAPLERPNVSLQKSRLAPVILNEDTVALTYRLEFSNPSSSLARHVVIQDPLPAWALSSSFTSSGASVTARPGENMGWNVADLAPGAGGVITLTVQAHPQDVVNSTNGASIRIVGEPLAWQGDNIATTPPLYLPDLYLTKQAISSKLVAGGALYEVVYRIDYGNQGSASATGVEISDTLPSWVKSATYTATGPAVSVLPGANYRWSLPDLSPGTTGQITLTLQMDPSYLGDYSNTAEIRGNEELPPYANNRSTAIAERPHPDLAVEKNTLLPVRVLAPDRVEITYQIRTTNHGTGIALDPVIRDPLPAWVIGSSYASAGVPATARAGETYTWDLGDMLPGASSLITLTVQADPAVVTDSYNTVEVSTTDEPDSLLGDNLVSSVPLYRPDLRLTKQALTSRIGPSGSATELTYLLRYQNLGTGEAANVIISDTLPAWAISAGFTASDPAVTALAGQNYRWSLPDLAPSATGLITLTVQADPDYLDAYLNTAEIAGDREISHFDNNRATAEAEALRPDLALQVMGLPVKVLSADRVEVSFWIDYSNLGTGVAKNVVIEDLLPDWALSPSFKASDPAVTALPGTNYKWSLPDLLPGGSGQITVTMQVESTYLGGYTNTATISSTSELPPFGNNQATATLDVLRPDLKLEKKALPARIDSNPVQIRYSLEYANIGSGPATSVEVSDMLPAWAIQASFTASDPGVAALPGTSYRWSVPDLMPGASGQIILTIDTDPLYQGVYENTATISGYGELPPYDNNRGSAWVDTKQPDLRIQKTALPVQVGLDGLIKFTYRIDYVNQGYVAGTGVVISDVLPAWTLNPSFSFSGAPITARPGQHYVWDVGTLLPGDGGVISVTVQSLATYLGDFSNTAQISAANEIPSDDNFTTLLIQVLRYIHPIIFK